MFKSFPRPCIVVNVWAGIIIDMLVEVTVVTNEVWRSAVVESLIDVVTDEFIDVSHGVCADILTEINVSDIVIIVVTAGMIGLAAVIPASCVADVLTGTLISTLVDVLVG